LTSYEGSGKIKIPNCVKSTGFTQFEGVRRGASGTFFCAFGVERNRGTAGPATTIPRPLPARGGRGEGRSPPQRSPAHGSTRRAQGGPRQKEARSAAPRRGGGAQAPRAPPDGKSHATTRRAGPHRAQAAARRARARAGCGRPPDGGRGAREGRGCAPGGPRRTGAGAPQAHKGTRQQARPGAQFRFSLCPLPRAGKVKAPGTAARRAGGTGAAPDYRVSGGRGLRLPGGTGRKDGAPGQGRAQAGARRARARAGPDGIKGPPQRLLDTGTLFRHM